MVVKLAGDSVTQGIAIVALAISLGSLWWTIRESRKKERGKLAEVMGFITHWNSANWTWNDIGAGLDPLGMEWKAQLERLNSYRGSVPDYMSQKFNRMCDLFNTRGLNDAQKKEAMDLKKWIQGEARKRFP